MTLDSTAQDQSPALRLGLIGCGRIAQVAHLPAIAKSETIAGWPPSAIQARSLASAVAAATGCRATPTTEELLRPDWTPC